MCVNLKNYHQLYNLENSYKTRARVCVCMCVYTFCDLTGMPPGMPPIGRGGPPMGPPGMRGPPPGLMRGGPPRPY